MRWETGGEGLRPERCLAGPHCEFRGEHPLEEVPRHLRPPTCASNLLVELTNGVTGDVMVQNVVARPKGPKRWDRQDERTRVVEQLDRAPETTDGVREVFEHVEKKYQ